MRTLPAVTRLLERAYAHESDERAWLEGILDAAKDAFNGHVAAQAYTAIIRPDGDISFHSLVGDDAINERMLRMVEAAKQTDPSLLRRQFLSGPVLSVRRALARDRGGHLTTTFDRGVGARDAISAQGLDVSGRACAVSWLRSTSQPLAPRVRTSLARIAGHLSSAYRLRHQPSMHGAKLDISGEILVDGACAATPSSERSLRRAVLAIDRARRETGSAPDTALGHWRALVEGRWTIVQRLDTDGRRVLVARPNEPATFEIHALDAWERKVASFAALCHPSKLIAYELGITESAVSRVLACALEKLGLRSRTELVELHGAIVGWPSTEGA